MSLLSLVREGMDTVTLTRDIDSAGHATIPAGVAPYCEGSVNRTTAPPPSRFPAVIVPPCRRTSARAMARPRPEPPPSAREREASAR